ncbi:MAG: hypothetical protein M3Y48_20415 [Actinomycetota bacterium]|nr:hypothetical protein [Actinomycetota bacterium]MDQ2883452.1 hypothetical protein [Actinomycetota bacterium]
MAACGSPVTVQDSLAAPTVQPPARGGAGDREALDTRSGCGTERWAIKTRADPDVGLINLSAPTTLTTVGGLTSLTPSNPIPSTDRVRPVEATVYTLSSVLVAVKLEADSDYHLVVADGDRTMTVEIPLPTCVGPGSDPLRAGIANARQQFDSRYLPGPSIQHVNVAVTVTGVGFFDFLLWSIRRRAQRDRAAPGSQHHLRIGRLCPTQPDRR